MHLLRLALAFWLICAPAFAEDAPLTPEDVTEVADLIDAALTALGDYAMVESKGREFYGAVTHTFGAESRQALQLEWLIVMAVALQGRTDEAQGLARGMLEKAQRLLSADDVLAYKCLSAYAASLGSAGEVDEALAVLAEGLTEAERWLPNDALVIDELRYLQAVSAVRAEDFALAALAYRILDQRLAPRTDPNAMALHAVSMAGWAQFLATSADPAEAIPVYDRALAAIDAQFGTLKSPRMQPMRLNILVLKADALETAGRGAEVSALLRPVMAEVATHYGADSPLWADLAFNLAVSLVDETPGGPDDDEALDLLARVVAIREQALDPASAKLLHARQNYAMLLAATGRAGEGVAQLRAMAGAALPGTRSQIVYVLGTAQENGDLSAEEAVDAVLVWLQDSQSSGAAAAQRLLTARLEAGSDAVAGLLRDQSDLNTRLSRARDALAAQTTLPLSDRNADEVAALRDQIGKMIDTLDTTRRDLRVTAPELASATGQGALNLATIRARLKPDEALVVIDPPREGDDIGLVVAASAGSVDWHTFQVPGPEIEAAVSHLRAGIDLRLGVRSAAALAPVAVARDFDLDAAHWLYTQTLGQVAGVTAGKAHLWFDLRGAMAALPPQLMLVTPPGSDDFGAADWLIRHHSVTILPALSSLPPATPRASPAEGFLAFADARFDPSDGLAPLPETVAEVRAVAASLGQDATALRLGDGATEAAVKTAALDRIGTLYFATHGLVAGDRAGDGLLSEAALALTHGGGEDGFLTSSEIIDLHLNARIVVLSACNTASGGVAGAEALSGLTQAFLYAGARGLLVSHWPVESRSAARLMTDTFAALAAVPGTRMAEAQQQAILSMIDAPADPRWSHPAYWAPFVLVGSPD